MSNGIVIPHDGAVLITFKQDIPGTDYLVYTCQGTIEGDVKYFKVFIKKSHGNPVQTWYKNDNVVLRYECQANVDHRIPVARTSMLINKIPEHDGIAYEVTKPFLRIIWPSEVYNPQYLQHIPLRVINMFTRAIREQDPDFEVLVHDEQWAITREELLTRNDDSIQRYGQTLFRGLTNLGFIQKIEKYYQMVPNYIRFIATVDNEFQCLIGFEKQPKSN